MSSISQPILLVRQDFSSNSAENSHIMVSWPHGCLACSSEPRILGWKTLDLYQLVHWFIQTWLAKLDSHQSLAGWLTMHTWAMWMEVRIARAAFSGMETAIRESAQWHIGILAHFMHEWFVLGVRSFLKSAWLLCKSVTFASHDKRIFSIECRPITDRLLPSKPHVADRPTPPSDACSHVPRIPGGSQWSESHNRRYYQSTQHEDLLSSQSRTAAASLFDACDA
jgi:hypothetical protein